MMPSPNDVSSKLGAKKRDLDTQTDDSGEADQASEQARPKSEQSATAIGAGVPTQIQFPSLAAPHRDAATVNTSMRSSAATTASADNAAVSGRADYSSRASPQKLSVGNGETINNGRATSTAGSAAGIGAPAQPAAPRQHSSGNSSLLVQERENFLLFIKILFKILAEAGEPEVRNRAQRIVMECKRRSQQGDPNFIPLMQATEQRLRVFVGEVKWRRAHLFLHHYNSNRQGSATMRSPAAHTAHGASRAQPIGV